jgi:hypothetical protein
VDGGALVVAAHLVASRYEPLPVSMMFPPKVRRSTMAVQSLGSVKVLVHEETDSLEAIATLFFSSCSVRAWNRRHLRVPCPVPVLDAEGLNRRCRP